jgi:very-short-patch-repair endonuclease
MGLDNDLYSELCDLRDRLRKENTYSNGREPPICDDDALNEMALRIPTKLEDFQAIVGIGPKFVEIYGNDFLSITKKYAITAAKGSNMDKDVVQTLRDLQKKLINISRANRLLFQPKTTKKLSFDLIKIQNQDYMGLLFGKKRVLKLCDTARGKEDAQIYKDINEIIREVNRDQRERGQYDLYIAYPFAEGKLPGDEFDIRCPLALFPVILEKDARSISLSFDSSRDPVYNNSLVTAFVKFSGKNRPLPSNVIDDYTAESFISNLIQFYADQKIPINCIYGLPTEFIEYKTGEFPKYGPGEVNMVQNMVLGKYPTYSNSIQKDFDDLISKGEINEILCDLVADLNLSDYLSELPHPLSAEDIKSRGMETSEVNITYINSLNSAQENVLTAINKDDRLVVQGPPGTGKSQVITGLITSAVTEGKTVLMVSEKKTALDVVYSRLGNLSKYCLMIDDVCDKEDFYMQLGHMLETKNCKSGTDLRELSESIDQDVDMLSNIARAIYTPCEFGIAPYKLYSMDKWLDLTDKRQLDEYRTIKNNVSSKMLGLRYPVVKELTREYHDPTLMNNFKDYCDCIDKTPWLTLMKPTLSEYNVGEMKADLLDLENQIKDLNSKGFMSRLFSKGKVNRDTTLMLDKYFESYNEQTINAFMNDPKSIIDKLNDYDLYSARATVYNKLNEDERIYGHNLLAMSKEMKISFEESNDQMYKYILNTHLQEFDAANKMILQEIQDFDSIIANIDRKIEQKKVLTRDKVEEVLQENLRYITESKRRGDINRIIENKRKWSLNKFINRYGYELFKGVKVWLLTPEVVSEIIPLEMGVFDLLIFDEASQMYVEKGIPSIYRAKKVVIAGDNKQLRPSNLGAGRIDFESDDDNSEDDEVSAALEEESLLDLARSRYDNILLNFHYRSKYEELIAFSNYAFYGGKLYVSPNVVQPERPPIEAHKVDGVWENKANMAEAQKVLELLKDFFMTRKENETIGIITFNVSQRDLINDLIDEESSKDPVFGKTVNDEARRFDNGEDVGLFIKNIESVQGDERDVIMFSIGYAKNKEGKLMQRFGWLNNRGGENRLNVAISRAKKKIHIVTSFDPEELQIDDTKNDGPKILKKYLQYAWAVNNEQKDLEISILNSFGNERWESDKIIHDDSTVLDRIYNSLVRKGYTVERNIGIGGYQIDLAIKQDGKFILGVECDSHIYEMSTTTRERDYHRQKYLESRGWHIHRVWTPGMWKNSEEEINKIVRAIEHKA